MLRSLLKDIQKGEKDRSKRRRTKERSARAGTLWLTQCDVALAKEVKKCWEISQVSLKSAAMCPEITPLLADNPSLLINEIREYQTKENP